MSSNENEKPLSEWGLENYACYALPNRDWYLWVNTDGNSFKFKCLYRSASEIREHDGKSWRDLPDLFTLVFYGYAMFDGVRHLYFGEKEGNSDGYLYYPQLNDLIAALSKLRELEISKLEYIRDEINR